MGNINLMGKNVYSKMLLPESHAFQNLKHTNHIINALNMLKIITLIFMLRNIIFVLFVFAFVHCLFRLFYPSLFIYEWIINESKY